MNANSIDSIIKQLRDYWHALARFQKLTVGVMAILILVLFGVIAFATTSMDYVELYPPDRLQGMDVGEIRAYLDNAQIPYKVKESNQIYIPRSRESQIRMELAFYGLPRKQASKGYELFDSNTWIKGEKELQILELRALKGQLEHDISQFENVRSANVILDIPPPRPFGGTTYKPKASVIVDLRPGTRLSAQTQRAITNHIAGAVRGLSPYMIAISDTNGRLYQAIDPDGFIDQIRNAELATEENIKAKIDGMLAMVVGYDNFYTTVQVTMSRDKTSEERKVFNGSVDGVNLGQPVVTSVTQSSNKQQSDDQNKLKQALSLTNEVLSQQNKQLAVPVDYTQTTTTPGKIETISIGVLIDERLANKEAPAGQAGETVGASLKNQIETQLDTILKGYNVPLTESVTFAPFDRTPMPPAPPKQVVTVSETNISTLLIALIAASVIAILLLLLRFVQITKKVSNFREKEQTQKLKDRKTLAEIEDSLTLIKERLNEAPPKEAPTSSEVSNTNQIREILYTADPTQLAAFLTHENPQTIALMLINLEKERAAAILKEIRAELQYEVVASLAQMEDMDRETLNQILIAASTTLGGEAKDYEYLIYNSVKKAAEILNTLPEHLQRAIIAKLDVEQPKLAQKLRGVAR